MLNRCPVNSRFSGPVGYGLRDVSQLNESTVCFSCYTAPAIPTLICLALHETTNINSINRTAVTTNRNHSPIPPTASILQHNTFPEPLPDYITIPRMTCDYAATVQTRIKLPCNANLYSLLSLHIA